MSSRLRELATLLRKQAAAMEETHTKKCASVVVASMGLDVLNRKIYG